MTRAEVVAFSVAGHRHALPVADVLRAVAAVAVTPLAGGPAVVRGVIDVAGAVTPVMSVRARHGLPERELAPSDRFLLVRSAKRCVALIVDEVEGVLTCDASEIVPARDIDPAIARLRGVVQLAGGLALIEDLELFLSADEDKALDAALERLG